ncbi:MAG TPA: AarF/ABC1/UbiB kinase family protein [Pirellulaceae bacterium]|nr:AarF/ABC1/UbiB kinase family protein [Pirellulaceae bacterium]
MINVRSIPHIYRNVKRWTEIVAVLSKYGLADWLAQTNIEFAKDQLKHRDGEVLARLTREARIRLTLAELGPTFIKLGQLLSTRADITGKELAEELKLLQASTPADPPETVRKVVETELGMPLDELFAEFDLTPIASASIGQVHRARLRSGERVVVKVQHAGIESKVNEDLEVLAGLAQLAEQFPEFKPYRPTANVAEMGRTLRRELDYGREERNLHQFAELFKNDPTICIPKAHTELSTPRVLTMDMIDGIPLAQPGLLEAAGLDKEEVARRGANLYLQMIFTHGFFHADPHPGNIMLLPGNVIGLIDFGMVGRIDERLRENIEDMLMAIVQHDVPLLVRVVKQIGQPPPQLDEAGLANDVADFVGHYSTQALDHLDVGSALVDMTQIMRRYGIMLPPQVATLIKTLVTLEGTGRLLSPRFSLMEVMQPFQRGMILRRLSPVRQARKLRRLYMEVEQLVEVLPQRVLQILEQIQSGKFDVHLDHRGLGPSVNRLVLGLLASALFVGSSFLLSYKVPPLLFFRNDPATYTNWFGLHNISLLGLAGCTLSILIGLRLLWAIGKSGHLDQKVSK